MQRKIAFVGTAVMTVVLMLLRLFDVIVASLSAGGDMAAEAIRVWSVGGMEFHDIINLATMALVGITAVVIVPLCISKTVPAFEPKSWGWSIAGGWVATFCGTILTISVLLDVFMWAVFGQAPAIGNSTAIPSDALGFYTLVLMLVFGLLAGAFLAIKGFCWMSHSASDHTALRWLSLAPVLWMWFRLARYEISYASTIDINESFFDFATLVFATLFFLQFARAAAGIGKPPKSSLLIFALCTALVTLSGAPATFVELAYGYPIGALFTAIVDAIVGMTALVYAAMLVFAKNETPAASQDSEEAQALAWTEPAKEHPPVEPPFVIDDVLPTIDNEPTPMDTEMPETVSDIPPTDTTVDTDNVPTIDELLEEIQNEQDTL